MTTSAGKRLREVIAEFKANGAEVADVRDGRGSHKVLTIRVGDRSAQYVVSVSNNGNRAEKNGRCQIRRLCRELQQCGSQDKSVGVGRHRPSH